MIRAVLAVNVLVSAFPAKYGVPTAVLDAWVAGAYELVNSKHILGRMVRAWSNSYYRTRYTPDQVRETLAQLRAEATLVVPVDTVHGVTDDEEDDVVLATAVAAGVPYLVTGDHGFQRVERYGDVVILRPRAFLDVLDEDVLRQEYPE